MTLLYLEYDEYSSGGDALDDSEWPNYSDINITWTLGKVFLNKEKAPWIRREEDTTFPVKHGDIVYVLLVQYSSGNTFGSSYGNTCIEGIYPSYDAAELVSESIKNKSYHGYMPWDGYFESLEDVIIEVRKII